MCQSNDKQIHFTGIHVTCRFSNSKIRRMDYEISYYFEYLKGSQVVDTKGRQTIILSSLPYQYSFQEAGRRRQRNSSDSWKLRTSTSILGRGDSWTSVKRAKEKFSLWDRSSICQKFEDTKILSEVSLWTHFNFRYENQRASWWELDGCEDVFYTPRINNNILHISRTERGEVDWGEGWDFGGMERDF